MGGKMRKALSILVAIIILFNLMLRPCSADPLRKLGRGVVNILTGIVEIPKKVYLVSKQENALMGMTWGLLNGTAVGLLRTVTGVYEMLTFPIPVPAEYEPMIHPEFVFEEWE